MGTSSSVQNKKVEGSEIAEVCDNSALECLKKHWLWAAILLAIIIAVLYYFFIYRKKAAAKKTESGDAGASSSTAAEASGPVKVTKNRS